MLIILLLVTNCDYPKINEFPIIKKLTITSEDEKNINELKEAVSE